MSSLKPNNDILPQQSTQGSQAPQQNSVIINDSNLWANIPKELKKRPQWVVSGASKAPLYLKNEEVIGAKSTDPATWMSFNDACKLACDNRDLITKHTDKHGIEVKQQGYSIGYMLSAEDPFTCIDLDVKDASNCTDASQWTTPDQYDRYWSMVQAFNSYTETSRSGKGFHIWVKGNIGVGCRRDHVEVYSQERYIICTGHRLEAKPIVEAQALLENMVSQMRGTATAEKFTLVELEEDEPDDVIIDKAKNAGNGQKFNELCMGRWQQFGFPSQSEADFALMSMFCFYSESNEQCRRLFRTTALGKREKATKNDTSLNYMLKKIRARQEKEKKETDALIQKFSNMKVKGLTISEWSSKFKNEELLNPQKHISTNKFVPTNLSDVMNRPPMEWFVHGVLPKKGLATIYGLPATGKSFLMLDLLFAICKGEEWFGMKTKQSKVAYINLEDIHGMGNRLRAYQARKGSVPINDFLNYEISLNFKEKDHVEELINSIKEYAPNCGLVCIDTLAQSANGIDENSSTDMGMVIGKLKKLSSELNCLVLIVHHSGKTQGSGMRGHSSLLGAVDCAIEISSNGSTTKKWNIAKSKNGANDIERQFHLEPIPLGIDEDGNPISSAVVTPVIDIQAMNNHNKDSKGEANKDKRILQVIHDNPASPQKHWAELLGFSPDTMTKQKNRLIKNGFLTENGKTVTLTLKGLDLLKIYL